MNSAKHNIRVITIVGSKYNEAGRHYQDFPSSDGVKITIIALDISTIMIWWSNKSILSCIVEKLSPGNIKGLVAYNLGYLVKCMKWSRNPGLHGKYKSSY